MSKKRKRKVQTGSSAKENSTPTTQSSSRNRPGDFNPDYTYVKKDLRTIGILASIFITILVVLSFFI